MPNNKFATKTSQREIKELSRLEELAERRFQRTARTLYEPLNVAVTNLIEQFSLHGMARSSNFCHAVTELVFKQFTALADAFVLTSLDQCGATE